MSILQSFSFFDILLTILDISIVVFAIYKLLMIIKDTKAVQLVKGIAILMVIFLISGWLKLYTVNWLLDKTWSVIIVGIVVVFQPEIRRGLEQLGRSSIFNFSSEYMDDDELDTVLDEVVQLLVHSSHTKKGVLLIFQRETGLKEFIETGTILDAAISHELLENIFVNKSPLHDGAVIIKGNRIAAAGAFLPLTDNHDLDSSLGTRHRAAIGLSEVTDAIAVVVSEETGHISIANDGKLLRNLREDSLKKLLKSYLSTESRKRPLLKVNTRRRRSE